ncbi:MAG: DUF2264 domain-containing protein [Planctomycetota bacterium]
MSRSAPTEHDVGAGPTGEAAYRHFLDRADRLTRPLISLMQPGQSSLPIAGRSSNHGDDADRLEAFARPVLMLALWLRGRRGLGRADSTDQRVIAWAHEAMSRGSDPSDPGYWGTVTNYHQHAVEIAILTMALDIARDDLWVTLDEHRRSLVLGFIAQMRGHGGHRNNHLFFDVLALEFLGANDAGELGDDAAIHHHLDELERMHRGHGWFIDGGNESYDHYNAFAFHIYGLWWAYRYGGRDRARAQRWLDLAAAFLPSYAHLYAASGEPVPVGRSLTYRFNGVGVFPLAAANGLDIVPPGAARRLCALCIDFFMRHPIEQAQGCLSLGWTDHFEEMADQYSCAASPYWAAKGLLMLALEPDHPFFAAEEQATPAESHSEMGESAVIVSTPGWAIRHRRGETALINAGGSSSMSIAGRLGAWKWGKLVYHTGIDGVILAGLDGEPCDAALTARAADGSRCIGRQNTIPITVEEDRMSCQYQLGVPYEGLNVAVRTHLWWRGDWYIALHVGVAHQPTVFRAGAFALPDPTFTDVGDGTAVASCAHGTTRINSLLGFATAGVSSESTRQHLSAESHALPFIETGAIEGRYALACAWSLEASGEPTDLELISVDAGLARIRIDGDEHNLPSPDWPVPV